MAADDLVMQGARVSAGQFVQNILMSAREELLFFFSSKSVFKMPVRFEFELMDNNIIIADKISVKYISAKSVKSFSRLWWCDMYNSVD